jgi:hypothetical protein
MHLSRKSYGGAIKMYDVLEGKLDQAASPSPIEDWFRDVIFFVNS